MNTNQNNTSKNLSHDELVTENLFQILEEKYAELDKNEKDAIIMLLIELIMIQ